MNKDTICHRILGFDTIFVDAFHGEFLKKYTKNPDSTFILSHYHGDHYQSLPRDNKYQGPALIHCSHVTAKLLVEVHKVPKRFVVGHEYGDTFLIQQSRKRPKHLDQDQDRANHDDNAKITFYDANHCPGACIILISDSKGTTHLHTGDCRYHPCFESYPLLRRAVQERKLDLVYLDTTYCHPKHNFVPQEMAIESIASQTEELFSEQSNASNTGKTLVLLSCYSIGKEKVLYESSKRSNQLIYVNEKKWKMLECMQHEKLPNQKQHYMNILERCTRDSSLSDMHVIRMGLAGEMFPFFVPNFVKIANYVKELNTNNKYNRVVAFIPTGWANASNWNKKNAISTKIIQVPSSDKPLHVEVRLISYSEHSSYPELFSFAKYLRPRKIIPTVYSDQKHYRQIENRFRSIIDSTRVKETFFRTMKNNCLTASMNQSDKCENEKKMNETEIRNVDKCQNRHEKLTNDKLNTIVTMGFDRNRTKILLEKCNGNIQLCIETLLLEGNQLDRHNHTTFQAPKKRKVMRSTIKDYFGKEEN